jgi:hypothetical protein
LFVAAVAVRRQSRLREIAARTVGAQEPPEMLVTEEGFLAIDTPRGWQRTEGPGLAYFVPPTAKDEKPLVWIYISAESVGEKEQSKDMKAYIESDKANFRQRFKNGVTRDETPLQMTHAKLQATVVTFRSGEVRNAVEQVAYIGEDNRVLTLVLSASENSAFEKALPVFREFVSSYRGSITTAPN